MVLQKKNVVVITLDPVLVNFSFIFSNSQNKISILFLFYFCKVHVGFVLIKKVWPKFHLFCINKKKVTVEGGGRGMLLACTAAALLAFVFFRRGIEKKKSSLSSVLVPSPHCYNLHGQVTFAAGRLERLLCRLGCCECQK